MKCEVCGKSKAKKVVDPYQADVDNKEVWMWLCEKDIQERADDI